MIRIKLLQIWLNSLHSHNRRAAIAKLMLALVCVGLISPAVADQYPDKALRMIVPWPAGGATDAMARQLANGLSKIMGQVVVVENVGGVSLPLNDVVLSSS